MAATTPRTMTIEEYSTYEGEGHVDLLGGELVAMAAGFDHGMVAIEIAAELRDYARPRGLGRVSSSDTTFILSVQGRNAVRPDVAFVRSERIPDYPQRRRDFIGPPDLAVEVVSPTDRESDVTAKVRAYLEAGTRLVWVVDPEKRTAAVYSPDAPVRFLSEGDAFDGGDVLPGFSLPLAVAFE